MPEYHAQTLHILFSIILFRKITAVTLRERRLRIVRDFISRLNSYRYLNTSEQVRTRPNLYFSFLFLSLSLSHTHPTVIFRLRKCLQLKFISSLGRHLDNKVKCCRCVASHCLRVTVHFRPRQHYEKERNVREMRLV